MINRNNLNANRLTRRVIVEKNNISSISDRIYDKLILISCFHNEKIDGTNDAIKNKVREVVERVVGEHGLPRNVKLMHNYENARLDVLFEPSKIIINICVQINTVPILDNV